jgi:hypothetical protein
MILVLEEISMYRGPHYVSLIAFEKTVQILLL